MDNSIQAHQKELCNKLWAMANALRGNMEAYEFKNYILGMIFYYYLSDRTEKYMANLLKDDGISYEDAWADEEYKEAVVEEALRDLGFIIEPQFLFRKMVKMVSKSVPSFAFRASTSRGKKTNCHTILLKTQSVIEAWRLERKMFFLFLVNTAL